MQWTTEMPTEPGWYGFRTDGDEESDLLQFDGVAWLDVWGRPQQYHSMIPSGKYAPEWCGPLVAKETT